MTRALAIAVRAAAIALSLLFVFTLPAMADPQFPALTGQVVDDAHVLPTATRDALTKKLEDLKARTGDQMVVVTLSSLQGQDIDTYGYQLGRKWGIGSKGKDNGVLFIIAPKEHKARFDVGSGLEGTLTDIFTGAVLDEKVFPRFKAGDIPGGVTAGVDAVTQQLTPGAEAGAASPSGPPIRFARPHHSQGLPLGAIIAMIVIFLVLSRVLRFGFWPLFLLGGLGGRGGGWGGGDGGWGGGGGGGGFSGGGGSFGGGGASGSW
jgi:uncharacterized protein